MRPVETFVWGALGSVAVELVTLLAFYQSRPARLPGRYRKVGFWVTRFSLSLLAGAVAVGYDIDQRILAFNIGAATPLIVTLLAKGVRPGSSPASPAGNDRLASLDRPAGRSATRPVGQR